MFGGPYQMISGGPVISFPIFATTMTQKQKQPFAATAE
jgi:hypothetical protein